MMTDELFDAIYGVKVEAEEFFSELNPTFARIMSRYLESKGWRNGVSLETDIEAISRYFSPEGPYDPMSNKDVEVFYRDSDMTFFVGVRVQTILALDGSISKAKKDAERGVEVLLKPPKSLDLIIYEY